MPAPQPALLQPTQLLDYDHPTLQSLIQSRGWEEGSERERILSVYNFVRDEVAFGYNVADTIPASRVWADGFGQCNTKGILLMALIRSVGVPCRLHGFTIHKELQKGAITGIWYHMAPGRIVHCWVEVEFQGLWVNLEGFILDTAYLNRLQARFPDCTGSFCGYGVATDRFSDPEVVWNGGNTYIQKEGIEQDFGVFDDPDSFFQAHRQSLGWFKTFLYRNLIRHLMNRNVARIRGS